MDLADHVAAHEFADGPSRPNPHEDLTSAFGSKRKWAARQSPLPRSKMTQLRHWLRDFVAVNNAGTEGHVGPITDQTAESYAATFDTNVLGVILSMKHEVRIMQGQGSGSI